MVSHISGRFVDFALERSRGEMRFIEISERVCMTVFQNRRLYGSQSVHLIMLKHKENRSVEIEKPPVEIETCMC